MHVRHEIITNLETLYGVPFSTVITPEMAIKPVQHDFRLANDEEEKILKIQCEL